MRSLYLMRDLKLITTRMHGKNEDKGSKYSNQDDNKKKNVRDDPPPVKWITVYQCIDCKDPVCLMF